MADLQASMQLVYVNRGVQTVGSHLAEHYGIEVRRLTQLEMGVHRVDHDAGPPWVARVFHPGRPLERVAGDAAILAALAAAGIVAEQTACTEWWMPSRELTASLVPIARDVFGGR